MGVYHTRTWRSKRALLKAIARKRAQERHAASSNKKAPAKRRIPGTATSEPNTQPLTIRGVDRRQHPRLPFLLTVLGVGVSSFRELRIAAKPRRIARLRLRVNNRAGFAFFREWCADAGISPVQILSRRRISPLIAMLVVEVAVLRNPRVRAALKAPSRRRLPDPELQGPSLRAADSRQLVSQFDQRDRSWRGHRA